MPANTPKQFSSSQLAAASGLLYTVPAATTSLVKEIILVNTTAGALTATIRVIPSGGADTVVNDILTAVALAANETMIFELSTVMETGATLRGLASAATSINCKVSGYEVTA